MIEYLWKKKVKDLTKNDSKHWLHARFHLLLSLIIVSDGKGFVSQRREMLKEKDDNLQQEEDLLIVDITTSDFAIVCNLYFNPTMQSLPYLI